MASAYILSIVISKVGHRQESSLVILLEVDKRLEIRFYRTILTFCLAVCLQVKGGGESPLDAEEVAEQ